MVTVNERIGVLADALPRRRRRHPVLTQAREPSARKPSGARPPETAAHSRQSPGPSDLTGVRVLVVDDDASSLDYFSFALETCGAVVSVAMSAREALGMLAQVSPDVILSDIAMPGEDGYWLLAEIRRHAVEAVSRLPVVAATAFGREHSRSRILSAGFHEYLSKPVDPDFLCRAIAAAIGR